MSAKKTSKKSVFTKKKIDGKSVRNTPVPRHLTQIEKIAPHQGTSVRFSDRNSHPKKTIASLVIGILMIMVGSTLILVNLVLYSRFQGSGKITFDNVDPKIANEISEKIIYSTAENGLKDYYSPELDVLLKYPVQKYQLMEQVGFVSITVKDRLLLNENGELKLLAADKVSGTFNDYIADKYQKKYPKVTVSEVRMDGDYAFEKLYYSVPDPFDRRKTKAVNRLIISRKIKRIGCIGCDVIAYIDFIFNRNTKVEKIATDLRSILSSVSVSPKNLEENLTVEMRDPGVSFKVDRKKWEINQNSLSTYLYFRAANFEKAVKVKGENVYPYSNISIVAIESVGKIDETYWQKTIQEDLNSEKSFVEDRKISNFKIISQDGEERIGNLTFKKLVFERSNTLDPVVLTTYTNYYGYNEAAGFLIEIKINVDDPRSLGAKEVIKVLGTFQFTDVPKKVSYLSLKDRILGTASLQIDKSSLIGVNSVVHLFNRTCVKVTVKPDEGLRNSGGKSYDVCMAGYGSGFYVTKDGYIVSNAHVTHWNPDDTVIESLEYSKQPTGFWNDFILDVTEIIQNNGQSVGSGDGLKSTSWVYFLTLREKGLIDLVSTEQNYVEGPEPFKLNNDFSLANENFHKKAQVIDAYNLKSRYAEALETYDTGKSVGIVVPDLAILKVDPLEGGDYPTMLPADVNSISVGQSIQAIGFPGGAESDYLFSSSATTIPTLTRGTISAIKPNFDNTFKLVQIDASIAHGNSGGPIINSDARVVAVTTYGLSSEMGADFNAGVSTEEVSKVLSKNNVKSEDSRVSSLIRTGADELEKSYFKWAVRDFEKAIELYPASEETLGPLVKLANSKIEAREDKTPAYVIGAMFLSITQAAILTGGLLIFFVGSVLVMVIVKRKGGTNQAPLPIMQTPQSPIIS